MAFALSSGVTRNKSKNRWYKSWPQALVAQRLVESASKKAYVAKDEEMSLKMKRSYQKRKKYMYKMLVDIDYVTYTYLYISR